MRIWQSHRQAATSRLAHSLMDM